MTLNFPCNDTFGNSVNATYQTTDCSVIWFWVLSHRFANENAVCEFGDQRLMESSKNCDRKQFSSVVFNPLRHYTRHSTRIWLLIEAATVDGFRGQLCYCPNVLLERHSHCLEKTSFTGSNNCVFHLKPPISTDTESSFSIQSKYQAKLPEAVAENRSSSSELLCVSSCLSIPSASRAWPTLSTDVAAYRTTRANWLRFSDVGSRPASDR